VQNVKEVKNMKKAVSLALVFGMLSVLLCSCGSSSSSKSDSLIGTWEGNGYQINEFTFYDDGTCLMDFDSALYDWNIVNGNELKVAARSNVFVWEFDISGNTLTLTKNDYTLTYTKVS
jgi:hypothetical protein